MLRGGISYEQRVRRFEEPLSRQQKALSDRCIERGKYPLGIFDQKSRAKCHLATTGRADRSTERPLVAPMENRSPPMEAEHYPRIRVIVFSFLLQIRLPKA